MVYEKKNRQPKYDLECLKAWCVWKRLEIEASGDEDCGFVKAIEDVIGQVNNYKTRYEKLLEKVALLEAELKK